MVLDKRYLLKMGHLMVLLGLQESEHCREILHLRKMGGDIMYYKSMSSVLARELQMSDVYQIM